MRALGLGWTGAWRALDVVWAALFAWAPVGTRAFRAALGSAVACGAGGALIHALTRSLLDRLTGSSRGVTPTIALIAALAAALSPAWQIEAQAVAGSTLGACLVLVPVAILLGELPLRERALVYGVPFGLALAYEPLVFLAVMVSLAAFLLASTAEERRAWREAFMQPPAFAVRFVGVVPFAVAAARFFAHLPVLATTSSLFDANPGERGESGAGFLLVYARDEVGYGTCAVAIGGLVLALRAGGARREVLAVAAVVGMGPLAMLLGAPCGPTRYGAPVLASIGALYVLAAVAMRAVVDGVARAPVPFARASAAMILVLEMTFAARSADDAEVRADARATSPSPPAAAWTDAATGALPAGAVVLVRDARVESRLLAMRAEGELRADLVLVPVFDLGGRLAKRALAREPKLQAIWRDETLLDREGEWSLSQLAAGRPLVAPYDPRWDRALALARHLVPAGLFARFEPEPRGATDRRKALDDFAPARERLARAIDGDPELTAITATLLRARALALAATSERDLAARAIDDLRPFSPRDPVALELVKRAAAHPHGAIDVTGLVP